MISRIIGALTGLSAVFGFAVLPASAATLDQTLAQGTAVISNVSITATGSSTGGTSAGGDIQVLPDASSTAASSSMGVTVGADANAGGEGALIDLSSQDTAVVNYDGTGALDMTSQDEIATHDQLNAYGAGMLHGDSNIQRVQLSSDTVSMDYKTTGKLFGFIKVPVTVKATVTPSGSVTVSYPWYHFLVTTDDTGVQANLDTRVRSTLDADTTGSAEGSLSANEQAGIMADLYSVLSGGSTMSAAAAANADANVGGPIPGATNGAGY